MTDLFFVSVAGTHLPETLNVLADQIVIDIARYKDKHMERKGDWSVNDIAAFMKFDIQSYTIMPEMMPVPGGLLAAGSQQFTTRYMVVALVIVNIDRHSIEIK